MTYDEYVDLSEDERWHVALSQAFAIIKGRGSVIVEPRADSQRDPPSGTFILRKIEASLRDSGKTTIERSVRSVDGGVWEVRVTRASTTDGPVKKLTYRKPRKVQGKLYRSASK